ncbi:hypothetical protein HanRHA438_Chr07g0288981 [Helianthus annuus]|nr:hypothetical protein HanIR_Chr07g0300001 [Helianthus annuus]KAJ0906580.1 hypothetical protein HanRHA438_Chr07g0288981 [Helianthus annuus]
MASINGIIKPIAFKNAAKTFPRRDRIPFHKGLRTESKLSIPYGAAASASAASDKAAIVLTF